MTRIGIAVQHFTPYVGGAEQQAALLASLLAQAPDECQVVTTNYSGDLPARSRLGNTPVRRLPSVRTAFFKPLVNMITALVFFLLRGNRFDVVHTFCLSGFSAGALIGARLRGRRTTVRPCTTGCGGDIDKILAIPAGGMIWWLFRQADVFIAQTPELADELRQHGVKPEKIQVLPNQVSVDWTLQPGPHLRRETREKLGLPQRPTVLFVGRLVPQKNLGLLLKAWESIISQHDASLLIVGDGPEAALVEQMFENSSARDTIFLQGYLADVNPFYLASDIFVFPALQEAYGNVIAEAMAFGLAVASTPVGVANGYLKDGVNGRLLEEATTGEIARVVGELLDAPNSRESLGEAARELALREFAPDLLRRGYHELYRSLLQHSPAVGH